MSTLWDPSFDDDDDDSDDYDKDEAQSDVEKILNNIRDERIYYEKAAEAGDVKDFYMYGLEEIIDYCG